MSKIISIKAEGKVDFGAITPEEMIRFFIEHGVNRINSIDRMWTATKITTDGFGIVTTETETIPFHATDEMEKEGWTVTQSNEWEFDVN